MKNFNYSSLILIFSLINFVRMKTEVGRDITKVKQLLENGELAVVPTETVYGLAANGLDSNAIEKIFQLKNRPKNNPLILHFSNKNDILSYVKEFPEVLSKIADQFWPGPLTILLPKNNKVPNIVTSGLSRVAVRVPKKKILMSLLNEINFPLAAPSANLYGKISPTTVAHVQKYFDGKISYILDGDECEAGIESTIIGLENNKVVIYRSGSTSQELIAEQIGYIPENKFIENNTPLASGMVPYHYAPETPCYIMNAEFKVELNDRFGYIFFSKPFYKYKNLPNVHFLSMNENYEEAASKLYQIMHLLDDLNFEKIFIELLPDEEIGKAVNDKIRKATAK